MRRSKKSLGRAILVSFLSASMVMTTPVYALTVRKDQEINKDITNGLKVSEKSTVTINGNVSDKDVDMTVDEDDREDRVVIKDSSKVTINGNVDSARVWTFEGSSLTVNGTVKAGSIKAKEDTNVTVNGDANASIRADENADLSVKGDVNGAVQNNGGTVTVSGKVNAKLEEDEDDDGYIANGIDITGGTTTIGKDVTVDAKPSTNAAYIHAQSHRTDGARDDAYLNIGGNVSIHGSGSIYKVDDDIVDFYNPTGVSVKSNGDSNVHVNVAGKIDASSNGVATGIAVSNSNGLTDKEKPLQVNITSGSISATGNRIMDSNQSADLDNVKSFGIYISNEQSGTSDVNIVVKGDLTSDIGIGVENKKAKYRNEPTDLDIEDNSKVTTNIVVDGTIKGNDAAVYICNKDETKHELNLTAWKIESDGTNTVLVDKADKENKGNVVKDEKATKEQSDNINYIIRHDGTISLEGTRLVSVNGNDFQTARETEKLTIHVKVDDEKKYRVDRVEGGTATATKNADGSWTLIVPKNGGVDIRAVLVAIEQTKHNSSSSSGGGSSSTHPGVNNASTGMMTTTPEGATVQTNVTKNDNSTVTTAAVRIGTTTANVSSAVSDQNGTKVTVQNTDGNIAGASFKGVGQISADGATLVKEDGTTAKMAPGMLLSIENADGTSVGCFMDATGKTIATGNFEVYYMLGTDGKLHAHFVNPQGYFMTGIQVINGMTVTFNATGEMVSVL